LRKEELADILAQPDLRTPGSRRDAVLLSVLYDTGARVQELIDLSVGDVRLDTPRSSAYGESRKMRAVAFDGKDGPASTRSHTGKFISIAPNSSNKPLFQKRAQATIVAFGNPLHPSKVSRQSTKTSAPA